MSVLLSAYCLIDTVPTLATVLAWTAEQGVFLSSESPDWDKRHSASIIWKAPDETYIAWYERKGDEFFGEDIENMSAGVRSLPVSPQRDRVLAHLGRSRLVVRAQIQVFRMSADDLRYIQVFLRCFVRLCDGLLHADSEGYFEEDESGREWRFLVEEGDAEDES